MVNKICGTDQNVGSELCLEKNKLNTQLASRVIICRFDKPKLLVQIVIENGGKEVWSGQALCLKEPIWTA
jgi:hypothetical protein